MTCFDESWFQSRYLSRSRILLSSFWTWNFAENLIRENGLGNRYFNVNFSSWICSLLRISSCKVNPKSLQNWIILKDAQRGSKMLMNIFPSFTDISWNISAKTWLWEWLRKDKVIMLNPVRNNTSHSFKYISEALEMEVSSVLLRRVEGPKRSQNILHQKRRSLTQMQTACV